jgi:hypothetical protein
MSPWVGSFEDVGIPRTHSEAFLAAAETSGCVILTRTPGVACTMLLSEGYDGKCFHIKGKSCNWGPMAGFVCLDPLLNKSGLKMALYNLRQHFKSVTVPYENKRAGDIHLMITDSRVNWLVREGYIARDPRGRDWLLGAAEFRDEGEPRHAGEFTLRLPWALNRVGGGLWAVYYDRSVLYDLPDRGFQDDENSLAVGFAQLHNRVRLVVNRRGRPGEALEEWTREDVDKFLHLHRIISSDRRHGRHGGHHQRNGPPYDPVMALVNPHPPYRRREAAYLNATTGDYDLFGVWPPLGDPTIDDQRRIRKIGREDPFVGNITNRVFEVAQLINSEIAQRPRRDVIPNRVFHSDEAGNPFSPDLAFPVAAFLPRRHQHRMGRIDDLEGLRQFIVAHQGQYRLYINRAWLRDLRLQGNIFAWD